MVLEVVLVVLDVVLQLLLLQLRVLAILPAFGVWGSATPQLLGLS